VLVPTLGMVVRPAESMELTLRERNARLLAAGWAPAFPESTLDDEALRPVDLLVPYVPHEFDGPGVVSRATAVSGAVSAGSRTAELRPLVGGDDDPEQFLLLQRRERREGEAVHARVGPAPSVDHHGSQLEQRGAVGRIAGET
jgi:hypothetical protein